MDDISREQPVDETSGRGQAAPIKGPEELLARERSEIAEDLVVSPSPRRGDDGERRRRVPPPEPESADAAAPPPDDANTIDAAAAAAALAAEAEAVEIEEDLGVGEEEGLPPVPELADARAVANIVFVLMLTSREGLSMLRLAQACNTTQKLVEEALLLLTTELRGVGLPVELARTGDR